jgi:CelD/BcsL family acetyltransferase involved in cellulose biosynthesis
MPRTSGMNALTCPATFESHFHASAAENGFIRQIDIFSDLRLAEPIWRALEADGALATPYQRYEWIHCWQTHIGTPNGITPLLVVGRGCDGAPTFLWPLGTRRLGPLTVAEFLGGKHTNFNMALWRRDLSATIGAAEIKRILQRVRALSRVDLLVLTNQPESWDGTANPFLKLPHQRSPSHALKGALVADFETLLRERLDRAARRKWRRKAAALAAHGPLRFWRAVALEDVHRVLDAFFTQKAQRMRELGIADSLSRPGTRAFIEAAATRQLAEGLPIIELYACSVGDAIVATYGAVVGRGRFCGVFNSMIRNDLARESPGQLLLLNLVRMCCQRGLTQLDLGVGEARFKRAFCPDLEPLFDSFRPLSARGWITALGYRLAYGLKSSIKRSPAVWQTIATLRRRFRQQRARLCGVGRRSRSSSSGCDIRG